jgi:hypothetical protein
MNADPNLDPLRQVLRQGDPAAQEPGLTDQEVHAMRRAVLTAIPESRRSVGWFPLAATGVAVLLALALAVALGPWHRPPAPSSPVKSPVQVAAVSTPAPAPQVTQVVAAALPQEPVKRPAHTRPVRARKVLPNRKGDAPTLMASLPVREIQFSTPGGTRVIWELSAGNAR